MTHATVAANFDQTLDVQRCISSQVTLNHEVLVDILSELGFVLESQVLDTGVGVDTSGGQNIVSCLTTDTEDILFSLGRSIPAIRAILLLHLHLNRFAD